MTTLHTPQAVEDDGPDMNEGTEFAENHPLTHSGRPSEVLGNLRGADMILTAAQAGGLPMPFDIVVRHSGRVSFQFWTLDELTQWAMWVDEVIHSRDGRGDTKTVLHEVIGAMFDQPLRLVAITDKPVDEHVIRVEENDSEFWKSSTHRSRRAVCSCEWASGWHTGPQSDNQAKASGRAHVAEVTA